jgi:hypothetical protein
MSSRWRPLSEAGDDFLDAAPFRYVNTLEEPVAPRAMWAALTADDTLVSWSAVVTGLRWTTPRPFGVGTTRDVTILRVVTARERYYRWDEGRRKSFAATEVSAPGLRRLAEDYVVEQTPEGSRLTWTLALEPTSALEPLLRLCSPVIAWALGRVLRGLPRQLAPRHASE